MAAGGFQLPPGMPMNGVMGANGLGAMPAGFMPGAGGYMAGAGPMRGLGARGMNGGMGYGGARMPGPYARNDGRGQRMAPGERPMMGIGMGGGLDAGAVGPREAVAGRQLRSYEDLDADTGAGTGELNY